MKKRFIKYGVSAVFLIAFTGIGIRSVTQTNNRIQLRDIQLKDKSAELKELEIHYDTVNVKLDKMRQEKNIDQQEFNQVQKERDDLKQKLDQAEKDLQAKTDAKRIAQEKQDQLAQALTLTGTAHAAGGGNESIIWDYLVGQGFSRNQVAGIMGNLQQEHNFQTSDVAGGLGIAQWLGGRRTNLVNRGSYTDIYVQLDYLMWELNNTEAAAGRAIRATSSVEGATIAFQNLFERCGLCHESKRIQYAYALLARH